MVDEPLRSELLEMRDADQAVRAELAADGSLFDGYHPRMEELHRRNAAPWPKSSSNTAGLISVSLEKTDRMPRR